jgi:uncharacterized protein (TIGR02217 family)
MSQAVFPSLPGLAWDIERSVIVNTIRHKAISGREIAMRYQAYPLYRFQVNYEVLRDVAATPDYDTLAGFVSQMWSTYDTFLYTDFSDNSVTDSNFGTGDGTTTKFQLTRTFGAGGFTVKEPVQNVNVLTNIKKNSVVQTNPTNYTIDANGLVTFAVAPAAALPLTWTGTYYYRCRLESDEVDVNNMGAGMWNLAGLSFVGSPGNRV